MRKLDTKTRRHEETFDPLRPNCGATLSPKEKFQENNTLQNRRALFVASRLRVSSLLFKTVAASDDKSRGGLGGLSRIGARFISAERLAGARLRPNRCFENGTNKNASRNRVGRRSFCRRGEAVR